LDQTVLRSGVFRWTRLYYVLECFIGPDCITFWSVSANFKLNSEIKMGPKTLKFYNYIFIGNRQMQKQNI